MVSLISCGAVSLCMLMRVCACVFMCMVIFLGRPIALPKTSTRSKFLFVPHLYDVHTRMAQVMEYCMNGDLGAYIKKHGAVS